MEPMQPVVESKVPRTLDEALALLARREAELAALRTAQQEWVHAVSHDLRAPLRHLLAFNPLIAELLQSPGPGVEDLEEARSFLQTMDQSAQRMAAMFEGLLSWPGPSAMCCSRNPWTCRPCWAVCASVCRRARKAGA